MLVFIIIFIYIALLPHNLQGKIFEDYGYSTDNFLGGKPWVIFTSLFLHGSVSHLILNMIALFFFGGAVEERLTGRKYLLIFFSGGLLGNLISSLFYSPSQIAVGASGAIFALMGAAILIKPFEFILFPFLIPIPIVLVGLIMILGNIMAILSGAETNIAYEAHITGFLVGLAFGFKEERSLKGLIVALLLLGVIILFPVVLSVLLMFDYTSFAVS